MLEFLQEYSIELGSLSIGTAVAILWRISVFFKKDKYLLPFVNIARTKTNEIFGKANVNAFLDIAKNVQIQDIPVALKEFAEKQVSIENMLKFLIQNQIDLGVFNEDPDKKEEAANLL